MVGFQVLHEEMVYKASFSLIYTIETLQLSKVCAIYTPRFCIQSHYSLMENFKINTTLYKHLNIP